MGSRGAGSGRNAYTNTADYKDAYDYEIQARSEEAAVPAALSSQGRDDDTVETQMRGYASAIGDPIRAMENQRKSIANEYEDYKQATSNSNLGTRDAMKQMLDEYDAGIERMKRIKKNSKRPDLLQ